MALPTTGSEDFTVSSTADAAGSPVGRLLVGAGVGATVGALAGSGPGAGCGAGAGSDAGAETGFGSRRLKP